MCTYKWLLGIIAGSVSFIVSTSMYKAIWMPEIGEPLHCEQL